MPETHDKRPTTKLVLRQHNGEVLHLIQKRGLEEKYETIELDMSEISPESKTAEGTLKRGKERPLPVFVKIAFDQQRTSELLDEYCNFVDLWQPPNIPINAPIHLGIYVSEPEHPNKTNLTANQQSNRKQSIVELSIFSNMGQKSLQPLDPKNIKHL